LQQATALARQHGLATHLDGARVMNAAVAQAQVERSDAMTELRRMTDLFDSVSVCLSKGLGAPVGSVLCGSMALVEKAHRWRKVLGGGMRQSGLLAAAALHALEHHVDRLAEDHDNAQRLAQGHSLCGSVPAADRWTLDAQADSAMHTSEQARPAIGCARAHRPVGGRPRSGGCAPCTNTCGIPGTLLPCGSN
jgi:threonine aldolase